MELFTEPNIYQLLGCFRHDLLNELQLLLGHIQLGRSRDVICGDVEKMVTYIQAVGSLFACKDDELATLLWSWQRYADQRDIDFQVAIEPLLEPINDEKRHALLRLGNSILTEVSQLGADERFMYISVSPISPQLLLKVAPLAKDSPTLALAASLGWQVERTTVDWRYWSVH